jgi:hypothetical protein
VSLKNVESWLKRGQYVRFLREICPRKIYPQNWHQYWRHNRNPVNFGKWITTDESEVAGWYHSVMTIGPGPKPIRTGATLHTVCITNGPLRTWRGPARTCFFRTCRGGALYPKILLNIKN